MRKILLLSFLILVPIVADAVIVDGINYNLSGTTAEVTSYSSSYSGALVIPPSITYNENNYTVTSIGDGAFTNCSDLTELTIPSTIIQIGTDPNDNLFMGCNSLIRINITDLEAWCRISFTTNRYSNPLSANNSSCLYLNGEKLTELIIPNTITTIGDNQFYNCRGITSVTLPNSVTSIGHQAFASCYDVTTFNLPNSLERIGTFAFWNDNFTEIDIPTSVKCIGYSAFNSCRNLTSVTLPGGISMIPIGLFSYCKALTTVYIPCGVQSIGSYAFQYCDKLEHIYCYAVTVPTLNTNVFGSASISTATLHVPSGSKTSYQESWTGFGTYSSLTDAMITIGPSGVTTFCCSSALDFTSSPLKAYVASDYSTTTYNITMTNVEKVKASTGIVVLGEEGIYKVPTTSYYTSVTNLLVGVTSWTVVQKSNGSKTNYILGNKNGNVGFYALSSSGQLSAGKAYLPLTTTDLPSGHALARGLNMEFNDETTSISSSIQTEAAGDEQIFNLQGQRLNQPQKGINIISGKKVYIK